MADISQLERALVNADAAGDVEAATALVAEIRRMRTTQTTMEKPITPTTVGKEGFPAALKEVLAETDWGTRNIAGAGTALSNLWEGGKQAFGMGDEDRIKANRQIADAAPVGSIAGNIATYAPLALVPGVNTIAGGAALGAASGAIQPTLEGESRLANAAIGGVAGAAVPAAMRTGKAVKAAVIDPFTQAGRDRIAGGVINRAASDPQKVAQALQSAKGATPGFTPTVGQAADDAGIAALERTVRATDPKAFPQLDQSQRAALADAIRNMAGDPIKRKALVEGRENAVKALYDQAKATKVLPDQTIESLMHRPSMQAAVDRAKRLAAERGEGLAVPAEGATGRSLHDIKMGLDDAIGSPGMGLQGAERNAALGTKEEYLKWLESKIPEYATAKGKYAEMSKPINQMDIGQNLAERFIPALYRDMPAPAQLNSAALARAVTDQGDDIARAASGMKGATLEGTMSPEQMATLRGVLADAQKMKSAEMMGRGVGSDTVQKTAMSHLAAEAGIPNWLSSIARVPGGWAKRAGDVLYGNSDAAVQARLAEVLANPQEAAQLLQSTKPSQLAEALKLMAIGGGQSVPALAAQ